MLPLTLRLVEEHQGFVTNQARDLLSSQSFSDMCILTPEGPVKCHCPLLVPLSTFLQSVIGSYPSFPGFVHTLVMPIRRCTVETILQIIYTGKATVTGDMLDPIFSALRHLKIRLPGLVCDREAEYTSFLQKQEEEEEDEVTILDEQISSKANNNNNSITNTVCGVPPPIPSFSSHQIFLAQAQLTSGNLLPPPIMPIIARTVPEATSATAAFEENSKMSGEASAEETLSSVQAPSQISADVCFNPSESANTFSSSVPAVATSANPVHSSGDSAIISSSDPVYSNSGDAFTSAEGAFVNQDIVNTQASNTEFSSSEAIYTNSDETVNNATGIAFSEGSAAAAAGDGGIYTTSDGRVVSLPDGIMTNAAGNLINPADGSILTTEDGTPLMLPEGAILKSVSVKDEQLLSSMSTMPSGTVQSYLSAPGNTTDQYGNIINSSGGIVVSAADGAIMTTSPSQASNILATADGSILTSEDGTMITAPEGSIIAADKSKPLIIPPALPVQLTSVKDPQLSLSAEHSVPGCSDAALLVSNVTTRDENNLNEVEHQLNEDEMDSGDESITVAKKRKRGDDGDEKSKKVSADALPVCLRCQAPLKSEWHRTPSRHNCPRLTPSATADPPSTPVSSPLPPSRHGCAVIAVTSPSAQPARKSSSGCPLANCNRLFKYQKDLLRHLAMSHYMQELVKEFYTAAGEGESQCRRCDKILPCDKTKMGFMSHMAMKHKDVVMAYVMRDEA